MPPPIVIQTPKNVVKENSNGAAVNMTNGVPPLPTDAPKKPAMNMPNAATPLPVGAPKKPAVSMPNAVPLPAGVPKNAAVNFPNTMSPLPAGVPKKPAVSMPALPPALHVQNVARENSNGAAENTSNTMALPVVGTPKMPAVNMPNAVPLPAGAPKKPVVNMPALPRPLVLLQHESRKNQPMRAASESRINASALGSKTERSPMNAIVPNGATDSVSSKSHSPIVSEGKSSTNVKGTSTVDNHGASMAEEVPMTDDNHQYGAPTTDEDLKSMSDDQEVSTSATDDHRGAPTTDDDVKSMVDDDHQGLPATDEDEDDDQDVVPTDDKGVPLSAEDLAIIRSLPVLPERKSYADTSLDDMDIGHLFDNESAWTELENFHWSKDNPYGRSQ